MSDKLSLERLRKAVQTGAAARSRVTLQPAGGEGTKVFPPTYAGAVYATEKRRLPGYDNPVDCVLLDSVQSQANRLEEALQQAIDNGRFKSAGISLPLVEVDFTGFWGEEKTKKHPVKRDTHLTGELRLLEPVGKVTSLQAPHRIVDAILRDSLVEEEVEDNGEMKRRYRPFRGQKDESSYGQRLRRVNAQNATALFDLCPTALLLGMWDSTGPKGGMGVKFERAMVSEIVGINAIHGVRTSSRIDPIINKNPILFATPSGGWTVLESEAINEGTAEKPNYKQYEKKLSELNLGNVTPSFGRYTKGAEGPDPLKHPSLSFDYPDGAKMWATVTPVVLDRFPKSDPVKEREVWQEEVAGIVATACERLGLPAPIDVVVGTTSWHRGSPRATVKRRPLRGHPDMPDTTAALGDGFPIYPTKGGNGARPQLHVCMQFAKPVVGPILLCAGRFLGYGMCKPL